MKMREEVNVSVTKRLISTEATAKAKSRDGSNSREFVKEVRLSNVRV